MQVRSAEKKTTRSVKMPLRLVMLAVYMIVLIGCAANNPPAPVIGADIAQVKKGDIAPFNGTIFSPFYLDKYLEWKEKQ
jgi:hypothetical protein